MLTLVITFSYNWSEVLYFLVNVTGFQTGERLTVPDNASEDEPLDLRVEWPGVGSMRVEGGGEGTGPTDKVEEWRDAHHRRAHCQPHLKTTTRVHRRRLAPTSEPPS